VNVLVFSNWYNGLFDDSKMSGVELIHHGVRTVTSGDVRLSHSEQSGTRNSLPRVELNGAIGRPEISRYPSNTDPGRGARRGGHAVVLPAVLPAELEGLAGLTSSSCRPRISKSSS
jgi:hypothetical protein